jgi:hypothetical protein
MPICTAATLVRWSGISAIVGALLIVQAALLHPSEGADGLVSPLWVPTHFGLYVGYILVQLGLVGVCVRQFQAAGCLGVVGFVVAFMGIGFTLMEGRDHIFSLPILRLAGLQSADPDQLHGLWELILNAAVFSIGHVLLGVATFRVRVFPRLAGALIAIGAPVLGFSPPIGIPAVAVAGALIYGAGVAWLGYELSSG